MSSNGRIVIGILIGSILFAGLPLIGWGIADIQGFLSNPARLAYVVVVVILQAIILIAFPDATRTGGKGQKSVARQQIVIVLLQVFSLGLVIVAPLDDRHEILVLRTPDGLRFVGLALFAVGLIGANWAAGALGKQFSVQVARQQDHNLITEGIYRYVRHPRYLCIIVFSLGIALVFQSGLGLILSAALLGVLLWRIHDEEAFMHQEFGAEWEAYAARTHRLIPFIF